MKLDTLTLRYWQNFDLADGELEYLSEVLIEEESPLTAKELALRLMERRIAAEEAAWADRKSKGAMYQPREAYAKDDRLVFPALGDAVGTVVGKRSGRNPQHGPFDVIQVRMESEDTIREFASSFSDSHALNPIEIDEEDDLELDDVSALGQRVFEKYGEYVTPVLLAKMRDSTEYVEFGGAWFLKGFLLPAKQGDFNLAEAVLDLAGGFSSVEEILKVLEMPKESSQAVRVFSLNYALATDKQGRFEFAGTEGRTEWCLPAVAGSRPLRFQKSAAAISLDHVLDDVIEVAGGNGSAKETREAAGRWSHVLTFYDWYWGHLPYDKGAASLFVQPLFEGQECTRLQFLYPDSGEVVPVVLHYPGERQSGWLGSTELRRFFGARELVPGATVVVEATAASHSEGRYRISYAPAPATKLEMLDYEEGGKPVFRRVSVRCHVTEEMSLRRSRFSALETLRLLDDAERRVTPSLLSVAFQRVGEKLLRGPGIVYRASMADLFVAVNIERPLSGTVLRAIFEEGAYPCFYRDEEGFYVYDPNRSRDEAVRVRLTWDEAILDAGSLIV